MIGLSLSSCVLDILRGEVQLGEVSKIIAGTKISNDDEWRYVMEKYSKTYWYKDPEKAVRIAEQLRDQGKIEQPRVRGDNPPNLGMTGDHWVKSESEIKWYS